MIGLTCSWAWSMGPVLSPSCLCVLASQIVKRRRGAEPVSISFFLSIISCLPLCLFSPPLSLPPFIDDQPVSSSCCGRTWMLCMWVNEVHSLLFSVWKHFCLSCPVFKKLLNFSSVSHLNPNGGISLRLMQERGKSSLCFTAFSGSFLKVFALRNLVSRSTPYISALMNQWPY